MADYQKGTYEGLLTSKGYNVGQLMSGGQYGKNINPNEYQSIISSTPSPYDTRQNQISTGLSNLTSQKFAFDPNQHLPGIQNTAESIYGPQKAQLEALRQLSNTQAEQTKVQTKEDFAKRMQQEVESINRRGAYFSGGAVQNEQDIRTQEARTLGMQDLQAQAANFGFLAQQAGLSAEQTQFIQDSLYNKESSAYNRFQNERNFAFNVLNTQQGQLNTERQFARSVFESDRSYGQAERQFAANYELSQKQFEQAKDEFKWNKKKWGEEFAWDKFKWNEAQKKSGSSTAYLKNITSKFNDYNVIGTDGHMNQENLNRWFGDAVNDAGSIKEMSASMDWYNTIYDRYNPSQKPNAYNSLTKYQEEMLKRKDNSTSDLIDGLIDVEKDN